MDFCEENNSKQQWDRIRPKPSEKSNLRGYFIKNRGSKLCLDITNIRENGTYFCDTSFAVRTKVF